ncbi:MAG: PorT family protein [Bacteroidia bacterium]|nr:PorT family protein [Bacteroidia bacterium]NNJ54999.1 PorT family protein [Bacteroidia bacterium]
MRNAAILILGMLISQLSFAQTEFRFGLKGAANIGWISPGTKNVENGGSKLGWAYGIMGDYYFKPNYGLSVELLLSQINGNMNITSPQKFNADTSATVLDMSYAYDLQYMEIPISMKFRTKEIGNMTYWGNFGFSPSFLIKAKGTIDGTLPDAVKLLDPVEFNVNDNEGDDFTTDNFDDRVFLFRFPLIIGGGVEYKMAGSTSLQAGLRFTNSFTDMLVKDKDVNAKNNYLAISVGVLF